MNPPPFRLSVPSPLRRLLAESDNELWLKDDGAVCPIYGGNKPRKLVHLLGAALDRGAKRLVTVGAIGSHHVLATTLLGRHLGLPTTAIALSRPFSNHAEQTTKDTVRAGAELLALGCPSDLAGVLRRIWRPGDFFIPPGGSSTLGAVGYVEAVSELNQQLSALGLPMPDAIVVALGSGGTAAGLLAGLAKERLPCRLIATSVLKLPMAHTLICSLTERALRHLGLPTTPDLSSRLTVDSRWIGRGYGYPTTAGELAIAQADRLGLALEATYTGKAFACAIDRLKGPGKGQRILFWSTFSAVSLTTSTECAVTLPSALSRLFRAP